MAVNDLLLRHRGWCIVLVGLLLPLVAIAQPTVRYRKGAIQVFPAPAAESFSVYRGRWSAADWAAATAILGRRSVSGDTLTFRPLVAFTAGETYTVRCADQPPVWLQIPLPVDYEAPRVLRHYPTAATVPSNLLKLHLQFSQSMGAGAVYDHIELLDAAGNPIDRAILPLEPPLWNAERTILTLWLEPGRIKRELGPNQRLGPILATGRQYVLRVTSGLRDANGQLLTTDYAFGFSAGARDTLRPDPARWQLHPPPSGEREPLIVDSREALDWATAMHYLHVVQRDGTLLSGHWEMRSGDQELLFWPDRPWEPGHYTLQVDPRLEDLAGNNLRRLFDRPIGTADSTRLRAITLAFRVN